jgi:pimeloyl-ACP methyl ester carboxylesterase
VSSSTASRSTTFAGAGGVRLAADVWGSGSPVLLLHGGGQTRHAWRDTAARIADLGRCAITVDLRGHGDSDWSPDRKYSPSVHAADIAAIIAALGESPALIGASMGGIAAMIMLAEAPNGGIGAARCLVLVDVTPRMEPVGISRIREFMLAAPDGFASLDEAADSIAQYLPGRPRPTSTVGLAKNLRVGRDGRYRWHWDPRMLEGMDSDPAIRHERLIEQARAVRVPTLLVRGAHSDVVSAEGVRELRELIPHAEVAEVSEAGHMVAGDDNDSFTAAIVNFVGAH